MVTVRNYSVPYLGGTLQMDYTRYGVVRLTDTRMVWCYAQNNPAFSHFQVVDTPGGWLNNGTPTVTAQQMLPIFWSYTAATIRLNDNTFMLYAVDNGSAYVTGPYYVIEVGTDNTINIVDTGRFDNSILYYYAYGQMSNRSVFFPVKDNVVMFHTIATSGTNSTTEWSKRKLSYDPATKKLTVGAKETVGAPGQYSYNEFSYHKIPGRDLHLINLRLSSSGPTSTSYNHAAIFDSDGNLFASTMGNSSMPNPAGPLVPLMGDRLGYVSANLDSVVIYDYNYTSKTSQVFSSGQTSVKNIDFSTNPYTTYGLGNSYLMSVARLPFYTNNAASVPWRFKVFRGLDRVTVEQSPGSALNVNRGFGITTPPTVIMHSNQPVQIPELIGNKLVYMGFQPATNAPGWTVITLPST